MTQANPLKRQDNLKSVLGVCLLTVAALILGWVLMSGVTGRTVQVSQSGVSASVPAGWKVTYGLQGEEVLFWTADQLDPTHRYTATMMPAVPGGNIKDVAFVRILDRGQNINNYQVISQEIGKINGLDGYKVYYAYIQSGSTGMLPKVIQGVDFYLPQGEKVLIITLEDESSAFNRSLNAFQNFVETVRYTAGG